MEPLQGQLSEELIDVVAMAEERRDPSSSGRLRHGCRQARPGRKRGLSGLQQLRFELLAHGPRALATEWLRAHVWPRQPSKEELASGAVHQTFHESGRR